jgi:hypothetical protein
MTRRLPSLLLRATLVLACALALPAQDAALKDTLVQAKAAWAAQGDRESASAKFGQIITALEPTAPALKPEWKQVLCEAYNWMAVLDDRLPANRAQAPKHLQALLDLSPDFDIDRTITNAKLQGIFDNLRATKLVRVKLTFDPPGGTLLLDGKTRLTAEPVHYLLPGSHTLAYAKPGYQPQEQHLDLALKEARNLDLKLVRTSSALTVFTSPAGAELFLDGKSVGTTQGVAASVFQAYADKAGVRLEQLSEGFVVTGLTPGKHQLEVKLSCFKSKLLNIAESFTTPFADHDLEAVKLEPSRGTLTILSSVPGGELFLSGRTYGPVPVKELQVCAEAYDLQVRYAAGSFTRRIEILEGKDLTLTVRPKPRLTYVGFEGADTFAGRDRILGMLAGLGKRVNQVAFLTANKGETPQECLARLQASRDTELVLRARPVPGHPVHQVELLLSTLTGEEERLVVKALENDPLGALVQKLETAPVLTEPWAGLTLLDLPGAGGPWVLQADAAALRAGIKPFKPLLQVNGKAVATVLEVSKALRDSPQGKATVSQGEAAVPLAVTQQAVELPTNAATLSYPFVLADLRLRYLGATGDEASLLRLHQALALMHFREYDKALEVLRDARMTGTQGVSQGTLDFYTGVCLLRMGNVYLSEALQAFNQALKYPQATLFGPDGPLLAPLARQALEDLKP